jgi:hypothetical protein
MADIKSNDKMFGRGDWDRNRGMQHDTFSEALERAHAEQEPKEKPKIVPLKIFEQ